MHLVDQFNRRLESEAAAKAKDPNVGVNLPNSVADISIEPPGDWEAQLRAISPKSVHHSWLHWYYYRAKDRWVLYDCNPAGLVKPDQMIRPGLMGSEWLALVQGPAPRDLHYSQRNAFVSDMQHAMYRLYDVDAVPFWVLQGDFGGHQYAFSPDQRMFLTETGRDTEPPRVGDLPACPFDGRVIGQLQRQNRLTALQGSIDALRQSGSSDYAEVQRLIQEREIREVSLQMLEQQLGEVGEMVHALGHRKNTRDEVEHRTGEAARASEALAAYIETGNFIM